MYLYDVIAWVAVKFGIAKHHKCCVGTNFMRQSRVKLPISNATRVIFIPNFTAIDAILC